MTRPTVRRSPIRAWMVWTAASAILIVAAVMCTKFVSAADVEAAASAEQFNPTEYAESRYEDEIVPQIEDEAVDLATLLTDLADGADESDYGNAPGAGSSYSFPVEFTGVLGEPNGSIVPVTVEGVPSDVTVQVQIGPALNGTAIRDVTGTVSFNEFTNQLEFQEVATALNDQVRESALAGVDPTTLNGETVHVIGAFTRVNPALVSVVPVVFEVQP